VNGARRAELRPPRGPLRDAPRNEALVAAYWASPAASLMAALATTADGLVTAEAARRLERDGPNLLRAAPTASALRLFARQLATPLLLILVFAAFVSGVVGNWLDAAIVIAIVLGSSVLAATQEYRASAAVQKLRDRVRIRVDALRDGAATRIASEAIVAGDVVLLSAGSLVPGDGVVLEAKDFFINQAALTGESVAVEKHAGIAASDAPLAERHNCVFMGTSVRSGTARVLIVRTGARTVYGGIADRLRNREPETEFERGIRRYGYLLTRIMLGLVLAVFAANVFLERPPVEALLFAIALAVGISPELLPAIVSVTLSNGARDMARHGVIVKRLNAIENLGSMDVLCSDKTGTLTRGVLDLDAALDAAGRASPEVLRDACINAYFETGLKNPLDAAIVARGERERVDTSAYRKLDEIPYDFVRKRLSIAVEEPGGGAVLITKGAVTSVLDVCAAVERDGAAVPLDAAERARLEALFDGWSDTGYRVLGVARSAVPRQAAYGRGDERGLTFRGFLLFLDPPKPDARALLAELTRLGVGLKIITGDNRRVAAHVAAAVGLHAERLATGAELAGLRDEALWSLAERTDVFAEVDPNQKERIVRALKRAGRVVGYLGDGINDAPALYQADVGISVDQAVDVAKDAADFVLLEHDLGVLRDGVKQGRRTFANTIKYIAITTSANFGNMLSMAVASLFMPFLPLLAKQILLNNFLSDIPGMAIAGDDVDPELVAKPRRWDLDVLRRFMLVFGSISSAFDFVTFALLLAVFGAGVDVFRTGWFVESLLTELGIALVLRTARPLHRSRPGRWLVVSSAAVAVLALALPYLPLARLFDLVPLPPALLAALVAVTAAYVIASEWAKRRLHALEERDLESPATIDGIDG
jgi:Mg2+-importing ATPase